MAAWISRNSSPRRVLTSHIAGGFAESLPGAEAQNVRRCLEDAVVSTARQGFGIHVLPFRIAIKADCFSVTLWHPTPGDNSPSIESVLTRALGIASERSPVPWSLSEMAVELVDDEIAAEMPIADPASPVLAALLPITRARPVIVDFPLECDPMADEDAEDAPEWRVSALAAFAPVVSGDVLQSLVVGRMKALIGAQFRSAHLFSQVTILTSHSAFAQISCLVSGPAEGDVFVALDTACARLEAWISAISPHGWADTLVLPMPS